MGYQRYTLFDSEPFKGMGEIKRCCGTVHCFKGEIKFDGQIDGQMSVTIDCSFADAQKIIEAAMRQLQEK